MSDIFPLDLTEGCKSLPSSDARPISLPSNVQKSRRNYFNYSRSLSFGYQEKQSLSRSFHSFHSAAILFKDSHGLPVIQPLNSANQGYHGQEEIILNFFKCCKCYDLIPTSAKLVVIDTELGTKKALMAMAETGVQACPLWDSASQTFVGLLTVSHVLR